MPRNSNSRSLSAVVQPRLHHRYPSPPSERPQAPAHPRGTRPAVSLKYRPQPQKTEKFDIKLRKQSSQLRSCTLCIRGLPERQDGAGPPCRPPGLTLSVHGAREGSAPRAQVSSLWALPCPLPRVSDPLGGVDALPCPSSCGGVTAADLVKPKAKRLRAVAER